MTETKVWTVDEIKAKLQADGAEGVAWIEHAVKAVYKYQTMDEQQIGETKHHNGVGFNGPDGSYMSYVAKYLKDGRHLSGHHIEKARKKIIKYAGQLATIANEATNEL